MPEDKSELKSRIVSAVGPNGTRTSRERFANEIIESLAKCNGQGKDNHDPKRLIGPLRKIVQLIDELESTNCGFSSISLFSKTISKAEETSGVRFRDAKKILHEMLRVAGKVKRNKKPRSDVSEGYAYASVVACAYSNHFQKLPVVGKTAKNLKHRSKFDKVCDVVEAHIKKSHQPTLIGFTSRVKAVEDIKSIYNTTEELLQFKKAKSSSALRLLRKMP